LRETGEQLIEDMRVQLLRADVIKKEEGARAQDRDVIDAMIHQVGPDGIVAIHRERHLQFRSYSIHARHQDGLAHSRKVRREKSAEAADLSQHFWSMRGSDTRLNAAFNEVAEINIHAGARVSLFFHR